jgi:hypothetical protein
MKSLEFIKISAALISVLGLFVGAYFIGCDVFERLKNNYHNRIKLKESNTIRIPFISQLLYGVKAKLKGFGFANRTIDLIIFSILFSCLCLPIYLNNIAQLWYAKTVLVATGIILPFYFLTLIFDLLALRQNMRVPNIIDEFRGAFIKNGKIKQSLMEISGHFDEQIARLLADAAESGFVEDGLNRMKSKLDNAWFNIFVLMLMSFKENGGMLVEQLYRLNITMTRHNNIERKKNRRLIMYEFFGLFVLVLSVPIVFLLNGKLMVDGGPVNNVETNLIISRIVIYSSVSLITIRTIRRL